MVRQHMELAHGLHEGQRGLPALGAKAVSGGAAMSVPMSFDFGTAIRPNSVVKCSYGNDGIALLRYLHECGKDLGKVVVLYNDTGWAAKWWPGRVENGERLARSYGFLTARTKTIPWQKLLLNHGAWPDRLRRFCTEELKVIPTMNWLREHDPDGKAMMICGVRREESKERLHWSEFVASSPRNEGRAEWSPLVDYAKPDRDALIKRAGWQVLPHRSRECRCVLANAADVASWSDDDMQDISELETWLGARYPGKIKFMFHPDAKAGSPQGIYQVREWARKLTAERAAKSAADGGDTVEPMSGCTAGYCSE